MWLNAIITLTVYGHRAFRTKVLGFACEGAVLPRMTAEVAKTMQGQVDIEWQVENGSGLYRTRWRSKWETAKGQCSGSREQLGDSQRTGGGQAAS